MILMISSFYTSLKRKPLLVSLNALTLKKYCTCKYILLILLINSLGDTIEKIKIHVAVNILSIQSRFETVVST